VSLQRKQFSCPENGWNVSGKQIGRERFGKDASGSAEAEALARMLWPEEAKELLRKK
jgi:hypothetical protein